MMSHAGRVDADVAIPLTDTTTRRTMAMASQLQVDANRRNARRAKGPSPEKKLKTRGNSFKHGLSGKGTMVAAARAEEFARRRAAWGEQYRPKTDTGANFLDLAVAASIRTEECWNALDALTARSVTRAGLTWDQDRRAEAAVLAESLAKRPREVARQFETTCQGAELLIEGWVAAGRPHRRPRRLVGGRMLACPRPPRHRRRGPPRRPPDSTRRRESPRPTTDARSPWPRPAGSAASRPPPSTPPTTSTAGSPRTPRWSSWINPSA